MYGIEEATGLGGLAARAPVYSGPGGAGIRSRSSGMIYSPIRGSGYSALPYGVGELPSGGLAQVSGSGMSVERNPSHQLGHWREIMDWHNSPAPWILLGILLIYGWTHASYRGSRTRVIG